MHGTNLQNAPSAPAKTNGITFDQLLQTAKDLGADHGKGKDTQVKFLLKAVEGGFHNALDLSANKHGTGVDDAYRLAEAYVNAQGSATVFDAKAANHQKLGSMIRTGIKLGSWPKGGNGEPMATVNDLMTQRQNMRKDPAQRKKLDDAANTLMKYARAQLKRDSIIPSADLKEFCMKPQNDETTVESILEGMAKTLDKLVSGNRKDGLQDATQKIRDARLLIHSRLADIANGK